MIFQKTFKLSLAFLTAFLIVPLFNVGAQEQIKKGSLQWYLQGPQKTWSQKEYDDYYGWRNKVYSSLFKSAGTNNLVRRQKAIINGNKITTEIWNFGSISSPGNRVTDIVWEGLGYGYEFAPFVVSEVEVPAFSHQDAYIKRDANGNPMVDANGDTVWAAIIISDGLVSLGGEVSPDGREFWGWEPLATSDDGVVPYAEPTSERIPTSNDIDRDGDGKPDSWPEGWYNANLKQYVWPGALQQGASNADLESFFVVDDRSNREFEYYPFANDSTRRGLGIEIECRYYQWANPLAEDIIFLVFRVRNKSDRDLPAVTFGMWGDPHIGGPSNFSDDLSFFDRNLNMVYAWDEDGLSDVAGRRPGFFGYKFLESPGNPLDGIDNNGNGIIDESPNNGIDDDGDWNPDKDDVGADGVPNTGDRGENDGVPTAGTPFDIREPGEPNFEWTDLDESDQIGLTSFAAPPFTSQNRIANDDFVWRNHLQPSVFDSANSEQAGDHIFLYGSGTFPLPAGEARRFSVALLVGQDLDDLILNAETAQQIFEINYQFARPPNKPVVTAVAGDEKVTLYWDNAAEDAFDPISETFDFEGYVIYRSTDPNFLDQQVITDANGTRFLFEPLKTVNGASARFDLDNDYAGLSDIIFPGRGVSYNLGSNTGLRHSYIDSNNVVNGQTYYYAVSAFDRGSDSLGVPPTETSKNITLNPETNEVILDVNTVRVIPRAPTAGYVPGQLIDNGEANRISHTSGVATGNLEVKIIDQRSLEDGNEFEIRFAENPTRYSVDDLKTVEREFVARLDQFVKMSHENINEDTFVLASGGTTFQKNTDYELLAEDGLVRAIPGGAIADDQAVRATYRYFPVKDSELINFEEGNPFMDGTQLFVQDVPLALDAENTGWTSSSQSNYVADIKPFNNIQSNTFPADYEIRFFNSLVDSSSRPNFGYIKTNFEVWDVTKGRIPEKKKMVVLETVTTDSLWNPGERVIILKADDIAERTWEFTLTPPGVNPVAPVEGDIYFVATTRPFSSEDVYRFSTQAPKIDEVQASSDLDRIAVVPNPYIATNVIEPLDLQNPRDRGQRRLYFNHLPQECTIRIYTITGELVDTIEHSSTLDDGKVFWDLTTKDNFPIAYGVYIYHVNAGSLGQKIGRFAVIK